MSRHALAAAILVLATVSVFVAGCGRTLVSTPSAPAEPTPTVTVPVELPTTIAIVGQFGDQELAVLDSQIAAFERNNPDIRVEVLRASRSDSDRRESFSQQLDQGDPRRDIYLLNTTWLAEFAESGWLVPLDGYWDSLGVERADFFPSAIQSVTYNRAVFALPWTIDGGILYYRQDLLSRYGLEPPSSWKELQSTALEIKVKEGLESGYVWQAAPYEGLICNTLEFVWAYGGKVLDDQGQPAFGSEQTRQALAQMLDLIDSGATPAAVTTYRENAALDAFQSGEAAFMRNWAYAWSRIKDSDSSIVGKVGMAPLPVSCLGGRSLGLSMHSAFPEKALRFMAFLVAPSQQAQLALEGLQPPALQTVYQDRELLIRAPELGMLNAALSTARARPISSHYNELGPIIYSEMHMMLERSTSPEEAMANVDRQMKDILR